MIPLKLIMENFISHIYSELDFTRFDSALLVGELDGNPYISNATGKTSVFDAIRWVLTGKSRFSTKDKVVRRGKVSCSVTFEFSIDGEEYKIIRKLNKRSGNLHVYFARRLGKRWRSDGLTCDTPTMTNRKIIEIIKLSDDVFVNSIYFKQSDISGFASAKTSKRKEILKEVLHIGIWDVFYKIAKDNLKELEDQHNTLKNRLVIIGDVDEKLKSSKNKMDLLELEIENKKNDIGHMEKRLCSIREKISGLELVVKSENNNDIRKLEKERKDLINKANEIKKRRVELRDQIASNDKLIVNIESEYNLLKERLIELSKRVLMVSDIDNCKAKGILSKFGVKYIYKPQYSIKLLHKKKSTLLDSRNDLSRLNNDLNNLKVVELDDECPTCLAKITSPADILRRREERENFLRSEISSRETEIKSLSLIVDQWQCTVDDSSQAVIDIDRTELEIEKVTFIRSKMTHRNDVIQVELDNLTSLLVDLKGEYNKLVEMIKVARKSSETNVCDELDDQKKLYEITSNDIDKSKKTLLDLSIKHGIEKGYVEELNRKRSEINTISGQINKILLRIDVYKNLTKAFGKDGIQAIIMENVVEDLKRYTNSILEKICNDPMSINFITQKQTASGSWKEQLDIKVYNRNNELDFDDLSGGEQVRVSIALRLALSQLLMRRVGSSVKFLLLDEVDQALDRHGIDALADTITALSKDLKILVITHNEMMKEKFENIITIHRGDKGSVLKQ